MLEWERNALPGLKTPESDVKVYLQRHINPISPRRRWVTQRAALNTWFYHGRQWIESAGDIAPGAGVYHFREVFKQSLAAYKRPVTNIIAPAVDNEVARLTKKEYLPEVAASRDQPDWMFAAKMAKDVVTWDVMRSYWSAKREEIALNFCIDETAIVKTYWDEVATDMVPVASLDAVACTVCDKKLASPKLPRQMLETGLPQPNGAGFAPFLNAESAQELPPEAGRADLVVAKGCPFCGKGQLAPYEVSPEEAADGVDAIGNPLGRYLPRGQTGIEVVSIHEFYPENGGIGTAPHTSRVWHQMTARPLEDLAVRYPMLRNKLRPDSPEKILRLNPLYSDPALVASGVLFGLASSGMDAYNNHALVQEMVVAPAAREGLELGAHFVLINNELISRPLCVKVDAEGGVELVPKVKYHCVRPKRVPGMFWGRGFVSDLVPLQRRLNEIDAQVMDIRERGKPMMWIPQGAEIMVRRDTEGSLQIAEYTNEGASGWSPREGIFPGIPMTGNPYFQERQQILADAQLIGAPQDIELGKGAGGIKTTSGMMLAQDQAGTRREPRERGLAGLYEDVFQHILDMQKTFQHNRQVYQVTSDTGIAEMKSFDRTKIVGTMKLKMKATPGFDQALYDKEAVGEAIQMQLYDLSDPTAVDRALAIMRLPQNVNEGREVQIRRAEMAWSDFMAESTVPLLDTGLFKAQIWFLVFQRRWLADECLTRQRAVDFDGIWARLAGWEQVLQQAEAQDAVLRQLYGNHPPAQWAGIYQQATGLYQRAVGMAQATGVIPKGQPPPPGSGLEQPPPPPPQNGLLPQQKELRIYTIWQQMLGPGLQDAKLTAQGAQQARVKLVPEAESVLEVDLLLQMRAVIEALRMQMLLELAPPAPPPVPSGAPAGGPAPPPPSQPEAGGGAPPA